MKRILVLCTGNSCRSVMAEALINHLAKGKYEAVSAGSSPAGFVHPKALETLRHHGIAASEPHSKSWDEFAGQHLDLVITVCDEAASESCPVFSGAPTRLHWSTPDPAKAEGPDEAVNLAFDNAFALLKKKIEQELI